MRAVVSPSRRISGPRSPPARPTSAKEAPCSEVSAIARRSRSEVRASAKPSTAPGTNSRTRARSRPSRCQWPTGASMWLKPASSRRHTISTSGQRPRLDHAVALHEEAVVVDEGRVADERLHRARPRVARSAPPLQLRASGRAALKFARAAYTSTSPVPSCPGPSTASD